LAKIVLGKTQSREILLPVTPKRIVIELPLKTQKGLPISAEISFSKVLPDPSNHREITAYLYKAQLL
jgi:hypothetical protein